jgi:hypothetical protein
MNIARVRTGVIFICCGIVLLLNTLDYVSWSVWFKILSLWPVLLIAIGIELIFRKTFLSFLTILSPILLILAILGPVYFSYGEWTRGVRLAKNYEWTQPFNEEIKKAKVTVEFKAGELELKSDTLNLVKANLDYWNKKPECDFFFSDLDSTVRIRIKGGKKEWSDWVWKGWRRHEWNIRLNHKIPLELELRSKASDADLDLSDLKVDDLSLILKASDLRVKFGKKEFVKCKFDSDASHIRILIPEESGIKIESEANLTSTEFSGDLSIYHEDNTYQSENFESAPYKIDLFLEGSVSKLEVLTY